MTFKNIDKSLVDSRNESRKLTLGSSNYARFTIENSTYFVDRDYLADVSLGESRFPKEAYKLVKENWGGDLLVNSIKQPDVLEAIAKEWIKIQGMPMDRSLETEAEANARLEQEIRENLE